MNNKKNYCLVFLIILIIISFFLRFWKLGDWFYFMIDEGRDAFLLKRIIKDHRPVLIGPAVPGGIYLGPSYFYLSAPIYFLSEMNPLGGAITASLFGVFCVGLIYIVAKKLFSERIALFSAIFYTFSYLIILYNRIYWPLVFTNLFSLLTYFFLFKILKGSKKLILPLTLLLAIATQCEPATISLLILSIIVFFAYKTGLKNKQGFKALFIFLLFQIPLLLFDLRHDFFNTRAFIKLLSFKKLEGEFQISRIFRGILLLPKTFSRIFWVNGLEDVYRQINPCDFYVDWRNKLVSKEFLVLAITILLFFVVKFFKEKKHKLGIKILGIHLLTGIFGITFYNLLFPGYTHEWFFYIFFPAFCFIAAIFFDNLYKYFWLKPVVVLFFFLFIFLNLRSFFKTNSDFGFSNKSKAVKYGIQEAKGEDFFLDSLGSCFAYGGYRYLFYLYGDEPTHSYMDHAYADWVYPKSIKEKPKFGIVMVSPSDKEAGEFYKSYHAYKEMEIKSKKFGQIEVLVVRE